MVAQSMDVLIGDRASCLVKFEYAVYGRHLSKPGKVSKRTIFPQVMHADRNLERFEGLDMGKPP